MKHVQKKRKRSDQHAQHNTQETHCIVNNIVQFIYVTAYAAQYLVGYLTPILQITAPSLGWLENSHSGGQLQMVASEGMFKCLQCTVSTTYCATLTAISSRVTRVRDTEALQNCGS
jgi:hypothetical protein